MEKLGALWKRVTDSLWFLPTVLTVAGGALALLLIRYNDNLVGDVDAAELWWLFGGSADGARSVLEAISGSIITVTGVVFSVTIIALQLASSQFTPRVLRQFMASRANQMVLGVFIGTFTYTLLVQRTVNSGDVGEEFIPEFAVTVALALALTSIGFLIYFIDHAARSIQVSTIIHNVTNDTHAAAQLVFPDWLDADQSRQPAERFAEELLDPQGSRVVPVFARKAGYVQAVARRKLANTAGKHGVFARLEVEIGGFVLPGETVFSAWPAERVTDEVRSEFCDVLVIGLDRTPHQDVKHGVIELMDIAVKAMSPAVNDPTTAVNAIHRMSEILLRLAWRERGDMIDKDDEGTARIVIRRPRLDATTDLAFNQVRHYSAQNASVVIALIETLAALIALSPESARAPFRRHLGAVLRTAGERITDDGDARRVKEVADAALLRAQTPPPQTRPVG